MADAESQRRALIVNAYTIGQRGDVAITEGLIASLRAAGATHVAVAPRDWRDGADGWRALGADEVVPPLVRPYELPAWMRRSRIMRLAYVARRLGRAWLDASRHRSRDPAIGAYRDASVVVAVGGGYLGGSNVVTNLAKVVAVSYARRWGGGAIVAPITLAPTSRVVGAIIRLGMRGLDIFVRDAASQERFARLGLASRRAPDLALRSPSVLAARAAAAADTASAPDGGVIGWAPRAYRPLYEAWKHRDAIEAHCLAAITLLLESSELRLRFIPQVSATAADDDRAVIARLRDALPAAVRDRVEEAEPAESVSEAIEQYAACDCLIASRLHASLLAMAVGVPSLTIGYDPKVEGVLTELGLADRVVDVGRLGDPHDLAARLLALRAPEERRRTREALAAADRRFDAFDASLRAAFVGGGS